MDDRSQQRRAWAASGAMALTGRADGPPLAAPDGVVDRMQALGRLLDVDVLPLLAERAAVAGLRRQGPVSCGGAARLLRVADGWVAVSLPRDDDVALVPAWLELAVELGDDPWRQVTAELADRHRADVVGRAALLGLPVAAVPPAWAGADERPGPFADLPVRATRIDSRRRTRRRPLVVDLSSLWAGPLCARLLAARGARVVKVESSRRPDGARSGPAPFFALLHGGHEAVALDLESRGDVNRLRRLLAVADVVVEASRPRALEQLGLDAAALVAEGPSAWISITGHGREGSDRDRPAFGDDAAAAGGLLAWDDGGPCFVADAAADPLTGVTAAAAAVAALDDGGGWLIDVAMSRVAGHVAAGGAGRAWEPGDDEEATAPVAPEPKGRAPALGEHTAAVLAELRCG